MFVMEHTYGTINDRVWDPKAVEQRTYLVHMVLLRVADVLEYAELPLGIEGQVGVTGQLFFLAELDEIGFNLGFGGGELGSRQMRYAARSASANS